MSAGEEKCFRSSGLGHHNSVGVVAWVCLSRNARVLYHGRRSLARYFRCLTVRSGFNYIVDLHTMRFLPVLVLICNACITLEL
jgi:hypothetical protein